MHHAVRAAKLLTAAAAIALLVPVTAGAKRVNDGWSATPPTDYTKIRGLSQPRYATFREAIKVPAFDGRELYIEVVRPKASGHFPTILEASPYHGTLYDRTGTRILPEPRDADGKSLGLTGYFAPRGYAVRDD